MFVIELLKIILIFTLGIQYKKSERVYIEVTDLTELLFGGKQCLPVVVPCILANTNKITQN